MNYDVDIYINKLKINLNEHRFNHSLSVMKKSMELSKIYNVDLKKAAIAGLLHDCAKNNENKYIKILKLNEDKIIKECKTFNLVHSFVGDIVANKIYGIKDNDILNAIKYHSTGRTRMSDLEKIVLISDVIEDTREEFDSLKKIREISKISLNEALIETLKSTINHLLSKKTYIHPITIDAYNYIIEEVNGVR